MIYLNDVEIKMYVEKPFANKTNPTFHEKFIDVSAYTTSKNQDGSRSYSKWPCRVTGKAMDNVKGIRNASPGDKLTITKCMITNELFEAEDGKKSRYLKIIILDGYVGDQEPSKAKSTKAAKSVPETNSEEDLW